MARRARTLVLTAVLGLLVPAVAGPAAGAQSVDDPYARFGGVNASARSGGLQVSYDVEGVLPLPPPLVEVTVPTSRATTATGPSSLAFGSLAYPGDLVGNLPSLVEQSAPGSGSLVPPYPIATLAEFPKGPASNGQDIGTASAKVEAAIGGASATSSIGGSAVPGVVAFGAVTTSSRTGLEEGSIVARSRSEVASVSLLFGLVQLQDVVSDVVAVTDGEHASTDGSTTVGSVRVLGLPATIGPDGIRLLPSEAPADLGPLSPLADPLAQLGAAVGPLADAVGALRPVLQQVLGTATGTLDQLLGAAGVHLALAPLDGHVDGASASVTGGGLRLTLTFDGSEGPLAQLLALLPADQLPGEALPGAPVNTSPQALVNLLKERHITQVAVAPTVASVDASSAGGGDGFVDGGYTPGTDLGGSVSAPGGDLGFSTPLPALGGRPAVSSSARPGPGLVPGRAVGALAVLLVLGSLPLWWRGAGRLMDASLGEAEAGCDVAGFAGSTRRGRDDRGT